MQFQTHSFKADILLSFQKKKKADILLESTRWLTGSFILSLIAMILDLN